MYHVCYLHECVGRRVWKDFRFPTFARADYEARQAVKYDNIPRAWVFRETRSGIAVEVAVYMQTGVLYRWEV